MVVISIKHLHISIIVLTNFLDPRRFYTTSNSIFRGIIHIEVSVKNFYPFTNIKSSHYTYGYHYEMSHFPLHSSSTRLSTTFNVSFWKNWNRLCSSHFSIICRICLTYFRWKWILVLLSKNWTMRVWVWDLSNLLTLFYFTRKDILFYQLRLNDDRVPGTEWNWFRYVQHWAIGWLLFGYGH